MTTYECLDKPKNSRPVCSAEMNHEYSGHPIPRKRKNRARYQLDGNYFCKKHASYVALNILVNG